MTTNTEAKDVWIIRGCKSLEMFYERELPLASLSARKMTQLLQRLYCRHLEIDEIIDASVRKSSNAFIPALAPNRETTQTRFSISVGDNPWYAAHVIAFHQQPPSLNENQIPYYSPPLRGGARGEVKSLARWPIRLRGS